VTSFVTSVAVFEAATSVKSVHITKSRLKTRKQENI